MPLHQAFLMLKVRMKHRNDFLTCLNTLLYYKTIILFPSRARAHPGRPTPLLQSIAHPCIAALQSVSSDLCHLGLVPSEYKLLSHSIITTSVAGSSSLLTVGPSSGGENETQNSCSGATRFKSNTIRSSSPWI